MTDSVRLADEAQVFADRLTSTIHAVNSTADPFVALVVGGRVVIRQDPREGVHLKVDGNELLKIKAEFRCCWDDSDQFLTVERSSIHVFATLESSQPIFRYEFERDARSVPSSHLHVHAHRDSVTYVMTKAGKTTQRARRRGVPTSVPSLQDLHLPLGGHRFRPALEDVLEMLVDEFGVDKEAHTIDALRHARQEWRETQTAAAVRDAPSVAAGVLRTMGFEVVWRGGGAEPAARMDRLRAR